MYSIHRVCLGRTQLVIGNISNFLQARNKALQLQQNEADKRVTYRVTPGLLRALSHKNTQQEKHSIALRQGNKVNQDGMSNQEDAPRLHSHTSASHTIESSQANRVRPSQSGTFSIERVVDGRYSSVLGEYASLSLARAKAEELQLSEHADNVRFRVMHNTYMPVIPHQGPRRNHHNRNRHNRKANRSDQQAAAQKLEEPVRYLRVGHSKPLPHVWGLDDRSGDISLAVRQEDEIGLGIPAQWGRGRRNRKGDYIP